MNNAIERLAAELMRLSNDEWAGVTERWAAGLGWDAAFGAAWEEISERLADIHFGTLALSEADEPQSDAPLADAISEVSDRGA